MATLSESVNALCMALAKVDLQLLPVGENKIPKFRKWQEGKFHKEEIIAANPLSLGIRMGDSDFETVDVDSKNAENPEAFKEEFVKRFKESGLDRSKFIIQWTQSGGFHLVYRTGIRTQKKKIATDNKNRTLIEIISERMYIRIYDEAAFYDIAELEYLTSSEYHTLLSLCYSFNTHTSTTGSFQEYNESHSCSDLLQAKGWTYVSTDSVGEKWLRDGESSQSYSATIFPNNSVYVFSSSTPLPAGQPLSPTDITAYYDFNGDKSAFGKYLKRDGSKPAQRYAARRFKVESIDAILERNEGLPMAKKMFGEFWFEGELCILFGRTNTGKSNLAFQIAMGIAKESSDSEHFTYEGDPKTILYFDLELSERQVSSRLKGAKGTGDRFLRVSYDSAFFHDSKTQQTAFEEIDQMIKEYKPAALILDNISVFHPDNEKASDATGLLNQLNGLKRRHNLPILAIGHTPKISTGVPIEITHLQGSAQMGNLIDSAFAIGTTKDMNRKYLKQVKVRETEFRYDSENVLLIEFSQEGDWVHFVPVEQTQEYELLSYGGGSNKDVLQARDNEIFEMYMKGVPREEIQSTYNIGKTRYYEIINKMKDSGPVN
jgi:archaellum biogenesis ATPase FlaH